MRRRELLRIGAAAGTGGLGTLAGCTDAGLGVPDGGSEGDGPGGGGSPPEGLAVRFGDRDWLSFDPVRTGLTHRRFYHESGERLAPNPQHGYGQPGTITFLVHRSTATDARVPATLVITYNAEGPEAPSGSATLSFDESIAVETDILVFDNRGPGSGDSYSSNSFSHDWNRGRGDGVVVALLRLYRPTFRVEESTGIDLLRVVTGDPEDPTLVGSSGTDAALTFDAPTFS